VPKTPKSKVPKKVPKRVDTDELNTCFSTENRSRTDIFRDFGASSHMTDQQWMLRNFTPFETDSSWINGIGKPQTAVLGKENIHIVTPVNDVSKKCTISDVLYTPSIGINLFAVGFFIAEGSEVHFTESREFIERNGALEMTATRIDNKLYIPSRYHCSSRQ
jgi:hypothetical protein